MCANRSPEKLGCDFGEYHLLIITLSGHNILLRWASIALQISNCSITCYYFSLVVFYIRALEFSFSHGMM